MIRIDLSDSPQTIKTLLYQALTKDGCFYVKYKDNDWPLLAKAKELFGSPSRPFVKKEGFHRGFIEMGKESGGMDSEQKEGFAFGFNWTNDPQNKLQGPNVWPESFDPSIFVDFFNVLSSLNLILSRLVVELFGISNRHVMDGNTISIVRLFHYFAHPDAIGSTPHTDWGWLTIIKAYERVPGLQVHQNGQWTDIPAQEGWYICNAGDFLSLITNGLIKSPLHRVVTTIEERTSFVYFAYPSYDFPTPANRSSDLSLFVNQGSGLCETHEKFGDFINSKWDSVSRY
jgi:isopenicillin N synthase-like dioxygenase